MSEAKAGKACCCAGEDTSGLLPLHWKTILVPTDLSEPSKRAVKTAAALAQTSGAKLILLHVAPMSNCCSFDMPPEADEMINLARKSLDEIAGTMSSDLAVEKIIRFGTKEPVDEIIGVADKLSADLIVLATHGYCGLKRVLLGSTAERVVRHASCPVLVVRSAGDGLVPACSQAKEQ